MTEEQKARWRKKPIEVEAFQWQPEMGAVGGVEYDWDADAMRTHGTPELNLYRIKTLEGWLRVQPGDWIITGIKGERYPCKPDIFAATYEPADLNALEQDRDEWRALAMELAVAGIHILYNPDEGQLLQSALSAYAKKQEAERC